MLDEDANRGKVTVGKILEAASTSIESFVGGREWFDHGQEVVIVVAQFKFYGTHLRRISRDRQRRFCLITIGFDHRLKTEPFESLRHRAAVPA